MVEIVELPAGEKAPQDRARVRLNVLPNGRIGFSGERLTGTVTQHHVIYPNECDTEEEAIAAATAWAEEYKEETLYIERSIA